MINSHNGVFSSKFELNQWPDNSTLPYAAAERLSKQRVQTLAEEASKRAQTQYLAKKFGQHVKIVRQYVDYAWAEAAKRDGIEPELIIAIMQKESSLRPRVQSRFGAQGLMQVIRKWHGEKLRPSESLFDPEVNIRVGSDILEEYLELAGGSLPQALKKYSGNARGYSNTVLKESRKLALVAEQAVGG
ncbi:transglycosylase SLT domain-containing protein [Pusillimonas sp. ANT_WB101]|uniref:transglycosylase SLT domain-containing protein n=1 Tax=Pusillimonas sp. ANT_WB101 TaxID=2597356 RepID=UPI002105877C|nr:transglycosylase SLT domain-containing protein [Pusillimonas sp. ANT_WB101]